MITLADIKLLAQADEVLPLLYDWAFKEDAFWNQPAIRTIAGNGEKYNVKTSRATISWQDPTEDIAESSPTFEQRSAAIYVAIMDVYLFAYAKATNKIQDADAVVMKSQWEDFLSGMKKMMILGQTSTSTSTKQPKGVARLLAEVESESTTDLDSVNNTQVVANHATSGALTLDNLRKLIDRVIAPNFLMMSKRSRRKVEALAYASGSGPLRVTEDEFGNRIEHFGKLPIYLNDWVPDNIQDGASSVIDIAAYVQATTEGAGYDNSIIFCGRVKDEGGFCITQVEPWSAKLVGTAEKKDADIMRIKAYMGFGLFDKYKLAGLINISDE